MTNPQADPGPPGAAEPRPDEADGSAPPAAEPGRTFPAGGGTWTARIAGVGLGGTGPQAPAPFVLVQFIPPGEEAPAFEALLPRGRFEGLYDAELAELLARARPLPPPAR